MNSDTNDFLNMQRKPRGKQERREESKNLYGLGKIHYIHQESGTFLLQFHTGTQSWDEVTMRSIHTQTDDFLD